MNKLFLNIGIALFLLAVVKIPAYALNMESSQFMIQGGNVNIGAKDQTSSNYNLSTTLGQSAANQFSSAGYIVKAGFQYIHSIIRFRFTVSNTNINFGSLNSDTPVTATTNLTVNFGGAGQYLVTAIEEDKLRTITGANNIPDTSCDGGANTCTTSTAKPWTSSSAYGFGYSMSGNDIPATFTNSTYYRPFANTANGNTPVTVMSNVDVGKNRSSTMTMKVNVSSVQAAGTYQTIIHFVATPSY